MRISDWSSDVCSSDLEALLDRGLALADEMLATSPYGLRLSKQALNLNIDAPSLEAAMAIEDRQQVILSATEDHREALAAFLEKRAPDYRERYSQGPCITPLTTKHIHLISASSRGGGRYGRQSGSAHGREKRD